MTAVDVAEFRSKSSEWFELSSRRREIAVRYEHDLQVLLPGLYTHGEPSLADTRQAYRLAIFAIRALVERKPGDLRVVREVSRVLHEKLQDAVLGVAPETGRGRRATVELKIAIETGVELLGTQNNEEGLSTVHGLVRSALNKIETGLECYAPDLPELLALLKRWVRSQPTAGELTTVGIIGHIVARARMHGVDDGQRFQERAESERNAADTALRVALPRKPTRRRDTL